MEREHDDAGTIDRNGQFFSLDWAQSQRASVNVFVSLARVDGA